MNRRTSLAVVLLMLAGGLSAPALVGPMLPKSLTKAFSPAPAKEAPAPPAAVVTTTIPRFGYDVTARQTGPAQPLDGLELAEALATPALPGAQPSEYGIGSGLAGSTSWSTGGGGSRSRGRSSDRVFTSGGSLASGTPGLGGWGLRDRQPSATGTTLRATAPGQSQPSASSDRGSSGGGGGSGSGHDAEEEKGHRPTAAVIGTTLLGGAAAPASGSMPAATPEPGTLLLVTAGAAVASFYRARRRTR